MNSIKQSQIIIITVITITIVILLFYLDSTIGIVFSVLIATFIYNTINKFEQNINNEYDEASIVSKMQQEPFSSLSPKTNTTFYDYPK